MAGYLRPKRALNLPEFDLPLAISLPRRSYVPAVKVRPDHATRGRSRYRPHPLDHEPEPQYDPAEIERQIALVRREKILLDQTMPR
jgi:hypothetical protein